MLSDKTVRLERRRLGWSHRRLLLTIAATSAIVFLFVANASQGRSNKRRADDNDEEHDDDHDTDVSVGASRAAGGTDRTKRLDDFPWLYILFRNPEERFRVPLDGHPTGYALELTHNIFLAHKQSVIRAGFDNGEWLMALKRAKELKRLDPTKPNWSLMGIKPETYGHMVKLHDLNKEFAIYELRPSDLSHIEAPWLANGTSLAVEPNIDYNYYPMWRNVKPDDQHCFLYTFSAYNWASIYDGVKELELPLLDKWQAKRGYDADGMRYFTRWPVKLVSDCNSKDGCMFVYDQDRYNGKANGESYNPKWEIYTQVCGTWQDAGAPILCTSKRFSLPPFNENDEPNSNHYERTLSYLSYIVRPNANTGFANRCTPDIYAWDLTNHSSEVWEKILDPWNCKYRDEYKFLYPESNKFPFDLRRSHPINAYKCAGDSFVPDKNDKKSR